MIFLHLRKQIFWIILLLSSLLLPACSIFRENVPNPTPDPKSIIQVTPDQVAKAMQEDHFFSDYRGLTLSIQGTAAAIEQQGSHWMVELQSPGPEKVICDLGSDEPAIKTGDAITVLAASADAQRGDSSVILGNCFLR